MRIFVFLFLFVRWLLSAWTTPKTWSSEPLTSTDLNTYIRDNQNHLHDRLETNDSYEVDEVSDYTTSSTSFVDVDGTNLSLTITTHGGDVMVGFSGSVETNQAAGAVFFNLEVDGSDVAADDGIFLIVGQGSSGRDMSVSFVYKVSGLSAGDDHTFVLRWKVSAGTATMETQDQHPQFWVQEI